jgi:hypothetical protein
VNSQQGVADRDPSTPRNTSAMAPFIPGDYVTWSGITNGGEILVYTLTAENVQQKTSADNGDPLYLRVEDVSLSLSVIYIPN